ncbi:MAG: chorismate mutase [Synergistaceae bacterium]|jgi:chorismate mutase/prephenate dehydratase|nr:chorismate mutase [Synergistaceae bacterium]
MSESAMLRGIRERIDEIDEQLTGLFERRMSISLEAARAKADANLPVLDEAREQAVVERAVSRTRDDLRGEVTLLMRSIMALSREYQRPRLFHAEMPLLPPPRVSPVTNGQSVVCAFQGVPGAWSEQALIKLFPKAMRSQVEFFEDVFIAVKEKRADYGVVAIENSTTGAIGETYDLLRKYGCFIVGRTWMDIQQCLLAPPGVGLSDIREVLSHPEGFRQCGRFLRGRAWDLTACRNTAVAALEAAEDKSGRTAAIGSRRAAELNGLNVLAPDIMDSANNRTSFVVIAAEPEYDEKSDLISITFSTEHRAGALCETLMPFMAQGINLMRIESRPATPDKYRFFAEINGSILNPNVYATLRQASAACEYFEVIGCYGNS